MVSAQWQEQVPEQLSSAFIKAWSCSSWQPVPQRASWAVLTITPFPCSSQCPRTDEHKHCGVPSLRLHREMGSERSSRQPPFPLQLLLPAAMSSTHKKCSYSAAEQKAQALRPGSLLSTSKGSTKPESHRTSPASDTSGSDKRSHFIEGEARAADNSLLTGHKEGQGVTALHS